MALLCSGLLTHSVRDGLEAGTEPPGAWLRLEGVSLSRPGWGLGADQMDTGIPGSQWRLGGFLSRGFWTSGHLGRLTRYPSRCSLLLWMDVRTGGEWHPWSQRHWSLREV